MAKRNVNSMVNSMVNLGTRERCFGIFFVLTVLTIVLPYTILEWFKSNERYSIKHNFNKDVIYVNNSFYALSREAYHYPLVVRNGMDYGTMESCKLNNSKCEEYIRNRLIKHFGDRDVVVTPIVENLDQLDPRVSLQVYKSLKPRMTLKEYYSNKEYSNYTLVFYGGIAKNIDEYASFLDFTTLTGHDTSDNNNNNFKSNNCSNHDIYCLMNHNNNFEYAATAIFSSVYAGGGSHMHYAVGGNIILQLAGRKQWLFVNPAYANDINCLVGGGVAAACIPDGYYPSNNNVSIEKYVNIFKKLGIPENAYFDVILEPGDILINPPLWAHAIKNLDEFTFIITIRGTTKKQVKNVYFINGLKDAIITSLKTKFYHFDFSTKTLLDGVWNRMFGIVKNKLFGVKEKRAYAYAQAKEKAGRWTDNL